MLLRQILMIDRCILWVFLNNEENSLTLVTFGNTIVIAHGQTLFFTIKNTNNYIQKWFPLKVWKWKVFQRFNLFINTMLQLNLDQTLLFDVKRRPKLNICTVCFTNLEQGSEITSKFSLPKSMKHTVASAKEFQ